MLSAAAGADRASTRSDSNNRFMRFPRRWTTGIIPRHARWVAGLFFRGFPLLACARPRRLRLRRELVRNVVLEDIAHVGRGLQTNALAHDDFHVVEPFVRVEAALL